MQVSVKAGGKDKFVPVEVTGTGSLADLILDKDYSLGVFQNNHRNNKNFQASYYVGLDFDDSMTIKEAELAFSSYEHIIATTKSHQKEKNGKPPCDRFRVILRTNEIITNEEDYTATILELMKQYPQADGACTDAARFFYKSYKVVSINEHGSLVPVMKYVKPKTEVKEVSKYMKGQIAVKTLEFIAFGAKKGDWNHRLFQAAIDCHEQNYSKEETIELLKPATFRFEGDWDSEDLKTINSAYERDPKHPPRKVESCFKFKHPTELSDEAEEIPWLVDGLLIQGGISIFAGSPKSGKSTITRQLAMAVSRGGKFFGREVTKGNVLYLALEEQENLIGAQLKHIGLKKEDNIMMHVGPIGQGNVNDNLRQAIETYDSDLVIIDTMLLMAGLENSNDYNETYKVISRYRNIARETGSHIILIHHKNKNQDGGANSVLGSTALQGAVDSTILLNNISGRELYRTLSTYQRGGIRFVNQEIKYDPALDRYEISKDKPIDF